MNIIPFAVLLALAVLGGLVALVGDRVGRKLGKKRLSLFGMRPRATAEFITVCAGAVIPIVTVGIVILASSPVREWLLESGQVLRQRDQQTEELRQGTTQLHQLGQRVTDSANEVKVLTTKLQPLRDQVVSEQRQVARKTNQLQTETNQLQTANRQYSRVTGEFRAATAELANVHEKLGTLNSEYTKIQATLLNLHTTYASLQRSYGELEKSYADLQTQRDQAKTQRDRVEADLRQMSAQLTDLNKEVADRNAELQKTQDKLALAQQQLIQTQGELSRAMAGLENLGNFTTQNLSTPVIVNVHEELAREYVPPQTNMQDAEAIMNSLLNDASDNARKRGAQSKAAHGRAADIIPLPLPNNAGGFESVAKIEQSVLDQMSQKPYAQVVMAIAYLNTGEGLTVPLQMKVVENPLVFRKNEPIADTVINGDLTETQISTEITDFLHEKVRPKAEEAKMIPIQGSDVSYGQVSFDEIISLASKIHGWGRSVRLVALANDDTHAADPLVLKFDLR